MAGVETHLMRTKLESVPAGVFIIGSHIQADSRKEKVPSHSHFLCALRTSLPHFISLSTVQLFMLSWLFSFFFQIWDHFKYALRNDVQSILSQKAQEKSRFPYQIMRSVLYTISNIPLFIFCSFIIAKCLQNKVAKGFILAFLKDELLQSLYMVQGQKDKTKI